jgi:signal peptidase I
MGKHTQDQFQTIKFVELQVGDIIVAKYQRRVYRPYFIVTDIKILKDDHHTPYENMTMNMLGGREKHVIWSGIFISGVWGNSECNRLPKITKNHIMGIGYKLQKFETFEGRVSQTGDFYGSLNKKKVENETLLIIPRNIDDADQKNLSF